MPIQLLLEFCQRRKADIIHLLQSRIVQTNSINRAAYLMPLASARFAGSSALNVVDIGTSSGLTMNFDRYGYHYGHHGQFGQSPVRISSEIVDGQLPAFDRIIPLNRSIGIDQNPLDLSRPEEATWLKALIWPDLRERFERMQAAIDLAAGAGLELHQASDSAAFRCIIQSLPPEEPLLVYHTDVRYQFQGTERQDFRAMLDQLARERQFDYRADYPSQGVLLEWTSYREGRKKTQLLGETNGHARWIKW